MAKLSEYTQEDRDRLDEWADDAHTHANSFKGLILAFEILSKYYPNGMEEKWFLSAEHDIIYFYDPDTDKDFHWNDAVELTRLGFHISSDTGWWALFV